MRVAFLHPDLGIGGAEQLVINLALSCKNLGWYVKIFTPSYDPNRAFGPVKDGTIDVEVRGNIFPRRIFGRFHALCEYIRMLFSAIYLVLFGGNFDMIIVDQIPLPIPILNIRFKTFFYCHFPDKLLCVERKSFVKRVYRFFIDLIEEMTMLFAHMIVVNSKYTQGIFKDNFKIISKLRKAPSVIYPCIELKDYDKFGKVVKEDLLKVAGLEELEKMDLKKTKVMVSLNRYERKKNLGLAVEAFINFMSTRKNDDKNYILIIAGGYDKSLSENKEVYEKLRSYDYKDFSEKVFFLMNISNDERSIILKTANVVLYTPRNEHFGIVPVESMYCGGFVIAHKSGGPTESVKDGVTGYLMDNEDGAAWADKINSFFESSQFDSTNMNNESLRRTLKNHVEDNFSLRSMKDDFEAVVATKFNHIKRN
jgi:alpha-1,3/alpha-1,6-mannosyltransferase